MVKTTGDGLPIEFPPIVDVARNANEVQGDIQAHDDGVQFTLCRGVLR